MMIKSNHSFHLVDQSPWPLTGALGAFFVTSGITKWFHSFNSQLFILGILVLSLTCFQWWRDISREGTFQGLHTFVVLKGLRWGMILFITSEVLFFFSFFWAFFHSSLAPTMEIGLQWPPLGINTFNPLQVPLLNTIILLASGVTVTWAHHGLMENKFNQMKQGLYSTIILGIYFTCLQAMEYWESNFSIADSAYGSISPFECGFDPKSSARLPFSLRFFLIALIFLIFDVEITLILPMPIIMNSFHTEMIIILVTFFSLILILGLFHEWNEGALNWHI